MGEIFVSSEIIFCFDMFIVDAERNSVQHFQHTFNINAPNYMLGRYMHLLNTWQFNKFPNEFLCLAWKTLSL